MVHLVDGMTGPETKAAENRMASLLVRRWKQEYSEMVGYVPARMARLGQVVFWWCSHEDRDRK